MILNIRIVRILWIVTASLSLIIILLAVLAQHYYFGVDNRVYFVDFERELIAMIASTAVLIIAAIMKRENLKKQAIVLGLLAYLFYIFINYSILEIYSLNVVYRIIILLFIALLSVCSLIFGAILISQVKLEKVQLPVALRIISAIVLFITALVFTIISIMIAFSGGGRMSGISEFLLTCTLLIPFASVILGILALMKIDFALLLVPSIFITAFISIFSFELPSLIDSFNTRYSSFGGFYISPFYVMLIVLVFVYLIITICYLVKLSITRKTI
jgi:hypothetical protein